MPNTETAISPFLFRGLKRYGAAEVSLENWLLHLLPPRDQWEAWMQESLGQILPAPDGEEVQLVQTVHGGEKGPQTHILSKEELIIGRAADADICLSAPAIGEKHARIYRENGGWMVEDFGSKFGTFVNQTQLKGNSFPLKAGDVVTLFPYKFEVRLRRKWAPESKVLFSVEPPDSTTFSSFDLTSPVGSLRFGVELHPMGEKLLIDISAGFAKQVMERLTASAGLNAEATARDNRLFAFLLLAVLETANQQIKFPFQFNLLERADLNFAPSAGGLSIRGSVGLRHATGAFRIFAPFSLLEGARNLGWSSSEAPAPIPDDLAWDLLVISGAVSLTRAEFSALETGDVLLPDPSARLVVAKDTRLGWPAEIASSDPWQFKLSGRLERLSSMSNATDLATGIADDLNQLPLTVHVVLGERTLSAGEFKALAKGAVIALERGAQEPVDLIVNNQHYGSGILVDIDGRIGVQITEWRNA